MGKSGSSAHPHLSAAWASGVLVLRKDASAGDAHRGLDAAAPSRWAGLGAEHQAEAEAERGAEVGTHQEMQTDGLMPAFPSEQLCPPK